jgi:pyrimidine operon attenuation protein / uracil phosphoribosyltransferase
MNVPKQLLNAADVARCIRQIGEQIIEITPSPEKLVFVGIRTHGVTLAQRLRDYVKQEKGWDIPLGILDITLYRDDLEQIGPHPVMRPSQIDFDLNGCTVILVDDVLYSGRTVRSALAQLMDYGRARVVRLAVLIDRGLRELPIQPDIVGLQVEAAPDEKVEVSFKGNQEEDGVWIAPRKTA